MRDTVTNKINSFVVTLEVADDPQFTGLWQGQPPTAFEAGLTAIRPLVTAIKTKGAAQSASTKGSAQQLKNLRLLFQTQLHALARGVYRALTAMGNTEDAAKVDLTPSRLHDARGLALALTGETILDLAQPLLSGTPPPAAAHFSQALYDNVDDLWQQFSTAVGAPATARSKKKGLTGELPADVRAIEAKFDECDDYLPQFALVSDLGRQFSDAWFAARHVDDLGRRASKPNPAPNPPVNP